MQFSKVLERSLQNMIGELLRRVVRGATIKQMSYYVVQENETLVLWEGKKIMK
jgi:hypothetical protein